MFLCQCASVCTCACMSVCACVRACMRVLALSLHLIVFIRLLSCFSLPSLLPSVHPSLRPFHAAFLPHVAPSPVGVDTERPKSALLTPHCCDHPAQTLGVTWASSSPSLYNINVICNENVLYYYSGLDIAATLAVR